MIKKKDDISISRVRELLDYNPDNGLFTWKVDRNRGLKGMIAGHWQSADPRFRDGYVKIKIDDSTYCAHRLAWLLMTGAWPLDQVDHINGDRTDNRWLNLRLANNQQNRRNSKKHRNNTSGIKGVSWDKNAGKWRAHIRINYKLKALGRFDNIEDARDAYQAAIKAAYGEFARLK
jgi:hypothetical protein